jgi:hypothetical protein
MGLRTNKERKNEQKKERKSSQKSRDELWFATLFSFDFLTKKKHPPTEHGNIYNYMGT